MPNITHRIGTEKATIEQVYQAVSTTKGLKKWWTTRIQGESKIGHIIQFRFSGRGPDFEVIDLQPHQRVEWKCTQGPKEWIDTHIEFIILEENEETILIFKHSGWREEVEFMYHCSTQWAYFLIGLKKYLEAGEGTPYGQNSEPISKWSNPS